VSLPRFRAGGIIRAADLNRIAGAAEAAISPPRAVTGQAPEDTGDDTPADVTLSQVTTTTETVTIEDPDDSETYVEVERRTVETFTDADGRTWKFVRSY